MTVGRNEQEADPQQLYGLVVESGVALHQHRPAHPGAPVDVSIRVGAAIPASEEVPSGRLLAHAEVDEPLYTFVERDDGTQLLRFYQTCDVQVAADLTAMTVHRVAGAPPGMESVMTTGAALAYQLYRRGYLVLHASAVQVDDRAWVFVGNSGMGKSTAAALLCADGGALITDDVLRVDMDGDQPVARLGATELRLRKRVTELAGRFEGTGPAIRTSADHRGVLRLGDAASDRLPIPAVIIPQPEQQAGAPHAELLSRRDALFALLGFPRLLGWQEPAVLRRQFEALSRLVARTPVVIARIPWGPPFPRGVGRQVIEAVGAALDSTA